jgi:uncharacterized protein YlxW (UPF0749 family)
MTDAPTSSSTSGSTPTRRSTARWLVALLCGVLGFALVTSAHTNRSPTTLETARPDDLVRILDGLTGQQDRLRQQADTLSASVQRLQSGRDAAAAALADAQRQVDALGILAGTTPAYGPGITLTLADPAHRLKADTLLDAVEELRDAGAEAIQVGAVRVVASTPFTDGRSGVLAGATALAAPYVLTAIGDAHTLDEAMRIPGGVVDAVAQDGATATIALPGTVSVTALRAPTADRYARPVPSAAATSTG